MRCAFCGEQLSRERPGIAGPGVAICRTCVGLVSSVATGQIPVVSPESRSGWHFGQLDPHTIEMLDDDALRHELGVARDIALPLVTFIAAVELRLMGDPSWRTAADEAAAVHRHHHTVSFPNGAILRACSYDSARPYEREQPPVFGCYFDKAWTPPWEHECIPWPDFGLPDDPFLFVSACRAVMARAQAGELIEIGCLGGHGRTGTALGVLARLGGVDADAAVTWVRTHYCQRAVETPEQEAFVRTCIV